MGLITPFVPPTVEVDSAGTPVVTVTKKINFTGGGATVTDAGGGQANVAISPGVALASTAPADVTKAAAAVGTGTTSARADHKHDVSTAAPSTTLSGATTNTEGTATSLSRSDHVHAVSTALVADIANVGTAAAAGTANTYPRGDHVHALTFTTVNSILGGATAAVSINSQKLTNVTDPTAAQDAATKAYADAGVTPATVQTTNATQTTLATITPTDATAVTIVGYVTGRKSDGTVAFGATITGVFRRAGATTTQVGATDAVLISEAGSATWDATFTVSGANVLVSVTGQAATTIDWRVAGRSVVAP